MKLKKGIEKIEIETQSIGSLIKEAKSAIAMNKGQLIKMHKSLKNFSQERAKSEKNLNSIQEEVKSSKGKLMALNKEIEQLKKEESLKVVKKQEALKKKSGLTNQLEALKMEESKIKKGIEKVQIETQSIGDIIKDSESSAILTKDQITKAHETLKNFKKEKIQSEKDLKSLQEEVKSSKSKLENLNKDLSLMKKKKATTLSLKDASLKEKMDVSGQLSSLAAKINNVKKEIEKNEIETQSIIDLQKEVKTSLSKETNKLGNYRQSLAKTLQEKKQSKEELSILKKELESLKKNLTQSKNRISKLNQEKKTFLSKKENLVKKKLAKKKGLKSITNESEKLDKKIKLAKEVIKDSEKYIEKRNIEIQTIKEIIKDRQKTHAESSAKAIQLKKQVESLTTKKDLAEKKLALANKEEGASRKKLKSLEDSTNAKMKVLQGEYFKTFL